MSDAPSPAAEPSPARGTVTFAEGDFHALSAALAADPQFNNRRLETRRKILALGKIAAREAGRHGQILDCRSSLHHPHPLNGMRVTRIRAALFRGKGERRRLAGILGAELGGDLASAHRNGHLFLSIEAEALEAGLSLHPEAWYDGQNLVNRVQREGIGPWRAELNSLGVPWRLQMHDWKGRWDCGALTTEALEEYLSYYRPGDHRLAVSRRWPAPPGARGAALGPAAGEEIVAEALRLLPLYRFTVWSAASDFLFG
ncbi:MAG: hypothetical protein AB1726_06315 [Planctomycetota bacterium]